MILSITLRETDSKDVLRARSGRRLLVSRSVDDEAAVLSLGGDEDGRLMCTQRGREQPRTTRRVVEPSQARSGHVERAAVSVERQYRTRDVTSGHVTVVVVVDEEQQRPAEQRPPTDDVIRLTSAVVGLRGSTAPHVT